MHKKPLSILKKYFNAWGAGLISISAGIIFLVQAFRSANSQESILDEGAYLFKGLLFASGQYSPYQPYGPWTNKMPLSFLIPGYIQYYFGPGLDVGRYFSIFLASLMLIGLWVLTYRLGGKWWAAAVVGYFAINPYLIDTYSVAVSQVLVACMLVWMLVFVLGGDRKNWQLALGGILAGLIVMTRINMFPVIPLLILYIYWQYGLQSAAFTTVSSLVTVLIGHALFWPDILARYANLLPRSLTPFLNPWRTVTPYGSLWNPTIDTVGRLLSLFQAARIHFTAILGALIAWLLWPRRKNWKNTNDFRSAIFLSALFIALGLFHIWAALGNDFCVFCLYGYLAFFSFVGLLLIVVTFKNWRRDIPLWLQAILVITIIGFSLLAGFSAFPEVGDLLLETRVPETLRDLPELEMVKLKKLLKDIYQLPVSDARRRVPTILGLGVGLLILAISSISWLIDHRKSRQPVQGNTPKNSFGYWLLISFIITGTFLAPIVYQYNAQNSERCEFSVLSTNHAAGEHLASLIPPGSQIYWDGGDSFAPLLYVPGIKIYPPQINGDYSFKIGGQNKPDELLRLGLWNSTLNEQWKKEADFIVVQESILRFPFRSYLLYSGEFTELESTPALDACDEMTRIRIFRRNP